jgi:glutamyl-tRNA synthetase
MILRIEDTDQGRFVPGAEDYIAESLGWCGIEFDESPQKGGPFAPYRQSERKDIYRKYAEYLIGEGFAYYAFDSPEELENIRRDYEQRKEQFQYDATVREKMRNSLTLPAEEVKALLDSGSHYVIRFKIPSGSQVVMNDIIRGEIHVGTSTLDDKVLFKSDGMPTYHLANIVDDHLMEITHVIRGEEWLPSLPLHYLLYDAFSWEKPQFAHLPLILKPDGKGKLSKRDGDKGGFPVFPLNWKTPEGEIYPGYRESGYYPEAFVNFLVLLGWNPGGEKEIFSMEELVQLFSLERAGKSGSRFDPEKAKWFNQQYLRKKMPSELAEELIPLLKDRNLELDAEKAMHLCAFVHDRVSFVNEIPDEIMFFFKPTVSYCEVTLKKKWKPETAGIMEQISGILATTSGFTREVLEHSVKSYIETSGLSFGAVMPGLRLLLTGMGQGPDLFSIMEILGREECLKRITEGLQNIAKL